MSDALTRTAAGLVASGAPGPNGGLPHWAGFLLVGVIFLIIIVTIVVRRGR